MRLWYARTSADESLQHEGEEHRGPNALHAKEEPRFDLSGKVRVIRLSDDGLFADRSELTDVIYAIRNPPGPVLVVWYVHGWKHNADEGSGDLVAFKELVTLLAQQQQALAEENRLHVVGVYIGWDGGRGPRGPAQLLFFWNRKGAADRISLSAVLTKIIGMAKYSRQQHGRPGDLTVMIGHSFGARILYSATSQVLMDEVQRHHPGDQCWGYTPISGPSDLIVLLNPAFEASMFTAFDSLRRSGKSWEKFDEERQQPLLLAIATKNDWATKYAFPVAKALGFRRKPYQRQTLGNYEAYFTHTLTPASSDTKPPKSTSWFDNYEKGPLQLRRNAISDANEQERGNPFVVATTTKEVIDGHNGIWGKDFRCWMTAFLVQLQGQLQSVGRHPPCQHS